MGTDGVKFQIIQGDALEVLRTLDADSVQCCVTSPPYWGLRDYKADGQIGLEPTPYAWVEKLVQVFRGVRRVIRPDGTLWLNVGDCWAHRRRASRQPSWWWRAGRAMAWRWRGDIERIRDDKRGYRGERLANSRGDQAGVQRNKGPMTALNRMPIEGLKPKDLLGLGWMLAFALQADGWWLRDEIIWRKRNCMPESVRDRTTRAHERIFLLTKARRYFWDAAAAREPYRYGRDHHRNVDNPPASQVPGAPRHTGLRRSGNLKRKIDETPTVTNNHRGRSFPRTEGEGRNVRSVWTMNAQPFPGAHFATFPPELPLRCIRIGSRTGDLVLDPFAGAGTTGLVANRLGRNSIGIELNPEYAQMARDRIQRDAPLFNQQETA